MGVLVVSVPFRLDPPLIERCVEIVLFIGNLPISIHMCIRTSEELLVQTRLCEGVEQLLTMLTMVPMLSLGNTCTDTGRAVIIFQKHQIYHTPFTMNHRLPSNWRKRNQAFCRKLPTLWSAGGTCWQLCKDASKLMHHFGINLAKRHTKCSCESINSEKNIDNYLIRFSHKIEKKEIKYLFSC